MRRSIPRSPLHPLCAFAAVLLRVLSPSELSRSQFRTLTQCASTTTVPFEGPGPHRRAILAIHRNQFAQAQQHIDKTRDLLDTELTALVGESYNRSYKYAPVRTARTLAIAAGLCVKRSHP